jgi:hypothetical protein
MQQPKKVHAAVTPCHRRFGRFLYGSAARTFGGRMSKEKPVEKETMSVADLVSGIVDANEVILTQLVLLMRERGSCSESDLTEMSARIERIASVLSRDDSCERLTRMLLERFARIDWNGIEVPALH